ncbi:hypothetical protein [Caloramator sp. E03]|nr:hypothetical protein [Caloramator sp. E03]
MLRYLKIGIETKSFAIISIERIHKIGVVRISEESNRKEHSIQLKL